jgi:predicted permease
MQPAARFLISPDAGVLFRAAPDLRILAFALGATLVTALALAAAPMLQIPRTQLAGVLQNETRTSASPGQVRFRKGMVAAQLAFCVWLMIGAGLFARSLSRLRSVDLGFRQENLVTFALDPSISGTPGETIQPLYRRVVDALAALPGVNGVADSDYGMMGAGIDVERLDIEGFQSQKEGDTDVCQLIVTPGYLRTLGMVLLTGRDFVAADTREVHTAIVNQAFAERFLHGQNPVGRHIRFAFTKQPPMEIVGMIKDQMYFGPDEAVRPMFYLPFQVSGPVSFYVRTSQAPAAMVATVRRIVEQQAPGVPITNLRTMEQHVDLSLGSKKQVTTLAACFGLLATLLAAIGLYGVMAYTVSRRTREIGIRMALGARRTDVMRMVLREVGLIIVTGLAAGVPTGLLLASLVRAQLFRISPQDPLAAGAAVIVVAAMAIVSGLLPARRATRVDPVNALRWD